MALQLSSPQCHPINAQPLPPGTELSLEVVMAQVWHCHSLLGQHFMGHSEQGQFLAVKATCTEFYMISHLAPGCPATWKQFPKLYPSHSGIGKSRWRRNSPTVPGRNLQVQQKAAPTLTQPPSRLVQAVLQTSALRNHPQALENPEIH